MMSKQFDQLSTAVKIYLQNQPNKTLHGIISTKTKHSNMAKKNQSPLNIFPNFIFNFLHQLNFCTRFIFSPYKNINCRKPTYLCPIEFKLGKTFSLSVTNFQKLDSDFLHQLKFGTHFNF